MKTKRIIVTGANGFLGKYLCHWFTNLGWEVVAISRNGGVPEVARDVRWDGRTLGTWAAEFEGAEVVVNLAGKSVNCRYGEKNKAAIFASRLESTKIIAEAMGRCEEPPRLWLNSSKEWSSFPVLECNFYHQRKNIFEGECYFSFKVNTFCI